MINLGAWTTLPHELQRRRFQPSDFPQVSHVSTSLTSLWIISVSLLLPTNSSLCYARAVFTSGIFAPKRIHVLGVHYAGVDNKDSESAHQVYNPDKDEWRTSTALPAPRHSLGLVVINDLLYAIRGSYEYALDGSYDYAISDETLRFTPIGYIPEFPSWTLLPLFLTATLVIAIFRKSLKKSGNILKTRT